MLVTHGSSASSVASVPLFQLPTALAFYPARHSLPTGQRPHAADPRTGGVVPDTPGHPLARHPLEERIGVELLGRHDAHAAPDTLLHQPGGDDRRNPGLVRRGLHPELGVRRLVVRHVVDVIGPRLARS